MNWTAASGQTIAEYVLDERLGGGSFGEVWRGREVASGRIVAIKLLTGLLSSPGTAAMRAEVETLAATAAGRSQHVVSVLGGGSEPVPYIVMEFIDGADLAAQLKDGEKLTPQQTIDVGLAISDALTVLNTSGIVHRDIKPANVMVDKNGVIKLADFGIAKIVGFETITMTGQAAMTMAYAAPEIWDEDSAFGKPSHRSDLYAMGVLLYQCLTGVPPFRGNYGALYRAHTERSPDIDAIGDNVPASLRELVRLCLEKRQTDRPESSTTCISMLQRAQIELQESISGVPAGEPTHFGAWVRGAPHPKQPWAWHCRHQTRGEEATVEVLTGETLETGVRLRRAVEVNSALLPYGAERLIETNRLLLGPTESWAARPPGDFQFWVARSEVAVEPAAQVTLPMLQGTVQWLSALVNAANGVNIAPRRNELTIRKDGRPHLARPGLEEATQAPGNQLLACLESLPLDSTARNFMAPATDFDALLRLMGASISSNNETVFTRASDLNATGGFCAACGEPVASDARWCGTCGEPVDAVPATNETVRLQAPVASLAGSLRMEMQRTSMSAASSQYQVSLYNAGRRPLSVRLDAHDGGDELRYGLQGTVTVPGEDIARVQLTVAPRKRRWFGSSQVHGFTVEASNGDGGEGGPPVTIFSEFEDRPESWPLFAGGAALGVALLAGGFFAFGGAGASPSNGPTATPTQGLVLAPTVAATVTTTPGPTATAVPATPVPELPAATPVPDLPAPTPIPAPPPATPVPLPPTPIPPTPTPAPPPITPPAPGTYQVNRVLGTDSGVQLTLTTVVYEASGRMTANFLQRNTGSVYASATLACLSTTPPETGSQPGATITGIGGYCQQHPGEQFTLATGQSKAQFSIFQTNGLDASKPITLNISGYAATNIFLR